MPKLATCLWFNGQAEEAARYYTSIFKNSRIGAITRYPDEGREIHGGKPGSVLMIEFEIEGSKFAGLNGGPRHNKFNLAISFQVPCASQKELDYYWEKLSRGGDKKAQECGWLKDKYGISWQVFPARLPRMLGDKDPLKANRVMKAMMHMKKLNVKVLERAYSAEAEAVRFHAGKWSASADKIRKRLSGKGRSYADSAKLAREDRER